MDAYFDTADVYSQFKLHEDEMYFLIGCNRNRKAPLWKFLMDNTELYEHKMAMDDKGTLYSLKVCKSEKNDLKVHVVSTNYMEPKEVRLYIIYVDTII